MTFVAAKEPGPGPDTSTSASIVDLQSTARWVVTSCAVVVGALLTGLSFAGIGGLAWYRVFALAAVAVAAVLLLGRLLTAAATVLTASHQFPETLAERMTNRVTAADANREARDVPAAELFASDPVLAAIDAQRFTLFSLIEVDELADALRARDEATTRDERDAADRVLWQAGEVGRRALAEAAYLRLMGRLRTTPILVVLCVVAVAWLSTDQDFTPAPADPITMTVYFDEDTDLEDLGLGAQCDVDRVPAVMIAGTLQEPLVVAAPANASCAPARFRVTEQVGVAIPDSPTTESSTPPTESPAPPTT